MIRVLLVDDQKIIRQGLQVLLEPETDIDIIGTADNGLAAIQQVEAMRPEVVLLDIVMPEIDGIAATRVIRNRFPDIKILVLSGHDDPAQLAAAMQAGAQGYLLKNTPAAELAAAIRSVHRGYAQMGPGLVEKMMGAIETEPAAPVAAPVAAAATAVSASSSDVLPPEPTPLVAQNGNAKTLAATTAAIAAAPHQVAAPPHALTHTTQMFAPQPRPNRWWLYLGLALILNAGLWGAALAVLRLKPDSYASTWALSIPAASTSTDVNIPGIGNATASSDSPFRNPTQDPRESYKFIASSELVLEAAATRLGTSVAEFGKPRIKILDNSNLMEFVMEGDTPDDARDRAIALNDAFDERLTDLRVQEVRERQRQDESTLQSAQAKLEQAQKRLADYRATADISSSEQLRDVSVTIEQLRQQRAELSAQQLDAQSRLAQLEQSLNSNPSGAAEAFALNSDQLFQQYLSDYSSRTAELTTLSSRFKPQSPIVSERQIERDRAQQALLARGEQLLGRSVTLQELQRLNLGSRQDDAREGLLQQLITNRADAAGLNTRVQELGAQVERLEARRKILAQQAAVLEDLGRDVQIAEAVFSSTLAKVDLTQSGASPAYPDVLTINSPSLPKESLAPEPKLVYLGTSAASVLICLAMFSLWLRSRAAVDYVAFPQSPSHYPALP